MSLTATNAQVYKGTAAVTYGGAPTSNTALSLPGTSGSYMNLGATHPSNFDTSVSNLFCEAWVYLNSFQTVSTTIIGRSNTTASPSENWMLWINSSKQPQFRVTSSGAAQDGSLATVMNTGQWYHLAGSWDNTNKKIYVFLNGTASAATNFSGTALFNSTWAIQLGLYTGGSGGQYVNGYVRDVRVTRGGIVPTASFTPVAAPFGLASPSYVASMGTTVLSLATQYYQTTTNGLLPQVFLAPSGTYPSFTTTSAPVFSSSNVAFTGAGFSSGNFINFGQTTITMALGYSIVFQFAWTGSYQSAYERIFDFGVAGGNSNAIIVYRNGTGSTINFGNFTGTSAQTITSTSTFPQNTVSGTVVCIYDPASTGSLKMYVNGSLQATLNGITIIPNGSFPSSLIAKSNATGSDPFSNVSIYSMKFYNRVLSAAEIARSASPISSIQFTIRPSIVYATGGFVYTSGINTIHVFATVGTSTFTVNYSRTCQILIVAGGGAGGSDRGGGGGAGGYVYYASQILSPGVYTITVGAGGVGTTSGTSGGTGTVGGSGGNSSITGLTAAIGGGGGGGCHPTNKTPTSGGSGGGGSQYGGAAAGAAGTAGQGNAGGTGYEGGSAGGGGGASSVGANASNAVGGNGGNGVTYSISGTSQTYCGGGGGGVYGAPLVSPSTAGTGGTGGGGAGSNDMTSGNANGKPATYFGAGGGGASLAYTFTTTGGNGYQGVVIISYLSS